MIVWVIVCVKYMFSVVPRKLSTSQLIKHTLLTPVKTLVGYENV